ncbi:MAG: NAD-binding protein [Chloroflexi bacterium]|nr:NAD-binding protein [Chloroflexota bacterium]
MVKRVGFIGLGAMGRPMSRNVLKGGFELTVHDLRPEPVEELVGLGARRAGSCAEAAADADLVITMVPSSPDVEAAALGSGGVIEGLRPGAIYIDMSTIAPATTRKVAERIAAKGGRMLDAPVARQVAAAVSGTLAIFVGGEAATLEEARPVLATMGTDIFHCGDSGAGAVVKIINNMLVGINVAAAAEAFVLGTKAGVKPEVLLEAVGSGSGGSFVLQNHFRRFVLEGKFEEGVFPVDYILKDLGLALTTGHDVSVPLAHAALAAQEYEAARAKGLGKRYFPVVITLLEELTGVQVRAEGK